MLLFRHFMNGKTSFEHIIYVQIIQRFLIMDLA